VVVLSMGAAISRKEWPGHVSNARRQEADSSVERASRGFGLGGPAGSSRNLAVTPPLRSRARRQWRRPCRSRCAAARPIRLMGYRLDEWTAEIEP